MCFNGVDLASLSERQHARLMLERVGWVRRTGPKSDLQMLDYVALPLLAEHGRRHAYHAPTEALERVGLSAQSRQRWGSLCDGERALIGIAQGSRARRGCCWWTIRRPISTCVERERVTELLRSLVGRAASPC